MQAQGRHRQPREGLRECFETRLSLSFPFVCEKAAEMEKMFFFEGVDMPLA